MTAPQAIVLLPAAERFGAQRLAPDCARALGRADRLPQREVGAQAQLMRRFELLPRRWPTAALTRQADAGDAAGALWLRADPAYVRPDINGARLMASGDALQLDAGDAAELLRPLKPLFGDAGAPIDAPAPGRWYLRLPAGTRLPEFAAPDEALGADMFEHLAEGPEGRRWRSLLNEAQIVLHNHPRNAERAARGLPPVNSLWFWGGSALPDRVRCLVARVLTSDEALAAVARAGGAAVAPPGDGFAAGGVDTLVDLRALRDLRLLGDAWLGPALAALQGGALGGVTLDLADGRGFVLHRSQRWRFWRRPLAGLAG